MATVPRKVVALWNSRVQTKGQDVIFKTALLVPKQEVTGYNPEIIFLGFYPRMTAKQWEPLWTGSKVRGANHPTLINTLLL